MWMTSGGIIPVGMDKRFGRVKGKILRSEMVENYQTP
jgi:hypothetical protein